MTREERIMSMWRSGLDTYEIARRMTSQSGNEYKETFVHKIIIEERNRRLKTTSLKSIEGGKHAIK